MRSVRTSLISRPFCQLHTDPRRDCQLAGRLKNGRRALFLGGLPFHKAVHPFFELISIDTQVFTNPVSFRFVGQPEVISFNGGISPEKSANKMVRRPDHP